MNKITRCWLVILSLIAPATFAAEDICPTGSSPDPNVLYCEDFEGYTQNAFPGWASGSRNSEMELCDFGGFGQCWLRSYQPMLSAGNNQCAGGYTEHQDIGPNFPSNGFYVRWYQFVGNNTVPIQFNTEKGFYLGTSPSPCNIRFEFRTAGAGQEWRIASYCWVGLPERLNQNQGNAIVLQNNSVYLIELYYNQSAGDLKVWADKVTEANPNPGTQTLRFHRTDARLTTSDPFTYIVFTLNHNSSDACIANPSSVPNTYGVDNIVVSTAPIGPIGGLVRPMAPTGFVVK